MLLLYAFSNSVLLISDTLILPEIEKILDMHGSENAKMINIKKNFFILILSIICVLLVDEILNHISVCCPLFYIDRTLLHQDNNRNFELLFAIHSSEI